MDADWSVELGADDPALEFPWSSPDGSRYFVDLQQRTEHLSAIPEAAAYPELGVFLSEVNRARSPWLTAKCDVWMDDELGEAEAIYEARLKFCSYVDLVARDVDARYSFEHHEAWVKCATRALSSDEEDQTTCEFIVRRCWYHSDSHPDDEPEPGFYITLYVFGYGSDEAQARAMWSGGLTRVSFVIALLRA